VSKKEYNQYNQSYRGSKAERKPFKIYTERDRGTANTTDKGIWFWVNPSECSWRVPLRTSIEQIQGGAIHHEWWSIGVGSSQPVTKFDQPVINFTFQSGNIIPNHDMDVGDTAKFPGQRRDFRGPQGSGFTGPPPSGDASGRLIPAGLGNFYDFMELLNQPNMVNGQPNYVIIEYISMMFPSLTLKGFFSQEGVQWSEQADSPLGIQSWGATFVVFESNPSLWNKDGLNAQYLQTIFPSF